MRIHGNCRKTRKLSRKEEDASNFRIASEKRDRKLESECFTREEEEEKEDVAAF